MKELREKLHKAIDEYGMTDEITLEISRILEEDICKEQRRRLSKWNAKIVNG